MSVTQGTSLVHLTQEAGGEKLEGGGRNVTAVENKLRKQIQQEASRGCSKIPAELEKQLSQRFLLEAECWGGVYSVAPTRPGYIVNEHRLHDAAVSLTNGNSQLGYSRVSRNEPPEPVERIQHVMTDMETAAPLSSASG